MNKILLFVGILVFCVGCNPGNQIMLDHQALQRALESAQQSAHLVGVSAAIIVPGSETWLGVSGESYPGEPITEEMLFDTGSAGKILLGPLMVKLVEDGVIALDDPIHKFIPDFPYANGSITIQQLLNHTSGLFMMVKHPDSPFRKPYLEIDHERWWTVDEIFSELGGDPYFAPGEGWCYTQAGYQLATLIVEEVTGETVGKAVQNRLLDHLDITGMQLMVNPLPDGIDIAHPWVDVDRDGEYEDVHADSRNWIASLSTILFYANPGDFAAGDMPCSTVECSVRNRWTNFWISITCRTAVVNRLSSSDMV